MSVRPAAAPPAAARPLDHASESVGRATTLLALFAYCCGKVSVAQSPYLLYGSFRYSAFSYTTSKSRGLVPEIYLAIAG